MALLFDGCIKSIELWFSARRQYNPFLKDFLCLLAIAINFTTFLPVLLSLDACTKVAVLSLCVCSSIPVALMSHGHVKREILLNQLHLKDMAWYRAHKRE